MDDKRRLAVITGGTAGIGRYTALGLVRQGVGLLITGRDAGRLAETVAWLKARAPDAAIETERGDFASLAEVRAMAERIAARHSKLDILVNNAGLIMPNRVVTTDGFETTFQVNHLAPFLLTHILLPALKAAAPSRIVTVSSMASRAGHIDFNDLNMAQKYTMWGAYAQSKLVNLLFTYALARRLAGTQVTVNALHPGFVASNFGNKGVISNLIWTLLRPIQISQTKGAANSIYAATSPDMEGVSGAYLVNLKQARSVARSYDIEAGERLWRLSAEMTGVPA
jgi:NAD(P)-dependent dehydrogenase (short-subunit alcohol dehydrogenase family)